MNAVLDARTQPLGSAPRGTSATPPPAPRLPHGEHLVFTLGAEEYGIDILKVQEIRSYEPPTRIANAPHCVRGVVNLRGVIVPIVDLRLKLGCENADYVGTTAVIVLSLAGRIVGAVVDSVSDVVAIEVSSVAPPPELAQTRDADCIEGIARLKTGERDRLLILLDIGRLLAQEVAQPTAVPFDDAA